MVYLLLVVLILSRIPLSGSYAVFCLLPVELSAAAHAFAGDLGDESEEDETVTLKHEDFGFTKVK